MLRTLLRIFSLFFFVLSFNLIAAEPEAEETGEEVEEEQKEPLQYFQIAPNIMTFYQNSGRKIGYIVVQVQIVVRGQENYDLVELHLPLMQDALIDFFNSQDKLTVQDLSKRETLRQQATDRVASVLKEEVGKEVIENLLFTQYIFQ